MSAICRFCLEDLSSEENPMIQPCKCKGSSAHVHENCLRKWRRTTLHSKNITHCQLCLKKYRLPMIFPLEIIPEDNFMNVSTILFANPVSLYAFSYIFSVALAVLLNYAYELYRNDVLSHSNAEPFARMSQFAITHSLTVMFGRFYITHVEIVVDKRRYFKHWVTLSFNSMDSPIYLLLLTACVYTISLLHYNTYVNFFYILCLQRFMPTHKNILLRMNSDSF